MYYWCGINTAVDDNDDGAATLEVSAGSRESNFSFCLLFDSRRDVLSSIFTEMEDSLLLCQGWTYEEALAVFLGKKKKQRPVSLDEVRMQAHILIQSNKTGLLDPVGEGHSEVISNKKNKAGSQLEVQEIILPSAGEFCNRLTDTK